MTQQAAAPADPHSPEYQAYLIKLAADNLCKGIIEEPRVFFDRINLDTATNQAVFSTPNVFLNGEQFPVRLLYMTASVAYFEQDGETIASEREIQRIGLQMRYHDNFYMRNEFVPLPLWGTKPVAAADVVSFGTSSYKFERPLILSSRDALVVGCALEDAPGSGNGVPVNVSFTGVGIYSRRPYFMFGEVFPTSPVAVDFPVDRFRNDGAEPMLITDMTVNVGGEISNVDPTGDSRRARISVRQVGNGTGADWFAGPDALLTSFCPGELLGTHSGRSVVHRFPGDGIIWEPGDGVTMSLRSVDQATESPPELALDVALVGYIAVQ